MNKGLRHIVGAALYHFYTTEYDPLSDLKGKKVAVIGAANTIFDEEWGDVIEECDIVIRVNKAPHSWTPDLKKYVGKKIDVLFHSFYENENSGGGAIDKKLFGEFNIKKIVNPNNNPDGIKAQLNFYKRNRKPIKTMFLKKEVSDRIFSEFGNFIPTIGFSALSGALFAQTDELRIKGFTFFKTPYYKGYRNNLENIAKNEQHIKEQGIHNPDLEFEVFKKFLKASPSKKIILDPFLKDLLNSHV